MIDRCIAAALLVAAGMALASCAPQTATLKDFDAGAAAPAFNLVDGRTAPEKSEWLSTMVWSCDQGIRRLGDDISVPTRLELLRRDLAAALGPRLAGKTVTVTRYTIFYNMNAFMVRSNPGNKALIGAVFTADNCPKEKVTGGWYDASEVTNERSPLVLDIGLTMDGKSYASRVVLSPEEDMSAAFGKTYEASVLFDAMHRAHEQLIVKLKSG